MPPQFSEEVLNVEDLRLDLTNPRMPDEVFQDEGLAMEYLADQGSLDELVESITSSGWLDYEPLIMLRETHEVIEGNRRLAALRLIRNPELAADLGIVIPQPVHEDAKPERIKVWVVDDRRDARDFIGFKHINGPFKWDSFAKAKYAAEWLKDEPDLAAVSKRLGDTHKTVERLVNGYTVLRQAEKLGFDRARIPGRFNFSHLYTGLTRPGIREYIGLDGPLGLLDSDPVPADHTEALHQLMVWLYGQDDVKPVIRSQNPDLKRLVEVLTNKTSAAMLSTSSDLTAAHAIVEDRPARFAAELFDLSNKANNVAGIIGNYDGDEELLKIAETLVRTVRAISRSMQDVVDEKVSK